MKNIESLPESSFTATATTWYRDYKIFEQTQNPGFRQIRRARQVQQEISSSVANTRKTQPVYEVTNHEILTMRSNITIQQLL